MWRQQGGSGGRQVSPTPQLRTGATSPAGNSPACWAACRLHSIRPGPDQQRTGGAGEFNAGGAGLTQVRGRKGGGGRGVGEGEEGWGRGKRGGGGEDVGQGGGGGRGGAHVNILQCERAKKGQRKEGEGKGESRRRWSWREGSKDHHGPFPQAAHKCSPPSPPAAHLLPWPHGQQCSDGAAHSFQRGRWMRLLQPLLCVWLRPQQPQPPGTGSCRGRGGGAVQGYRRSAAARR